MAGVDDLPVTAVGKERAGGGGPGEAGANPVVREEAEHGGRAVELPEPAAEAKGGDDAAPALADERGADEARWIIRRQAEEDLLDELF